MGEALGEDEELSGSPFMGKAGRTLDRLISRTVDPVSGQALRREDFLVDNVLRCRPPGNVLTGAAYEHRAIEQCHVHLDSSLRSIRPKVALALGNQALRRLTGRWGIDKLRGYYLDSTGGVPTVIGTYHPSYIMRGQWHLARVFQTDLLKALDCARNGRVKADYNYIRHPSITDVLRFIEEYETHHSEFLSFDLETPYDEEEEKDDDIVAIEDRLSYNIIRISFSFRPYHAITMPWYGEYRKLAQRLLAMHRPKLGWNCLAFDVPRLEADGSPVNGEVYDGMHMWQALEPTQRKGLGSVATWYCPDMQPWKITTKFSDKEWYSCADADVALRCAVPIRERLVSQDRWPMYMKHFVQCEQVLRKMTRRGVGTDVEKRRAAALRLAERYRLLSTSLQTKVPLDILPKKVYKKTEEQLKKIGSWEDPMAVVEEEAVLKPNQEVVDGWIVTKKKEKTVSRSRTSGKRSATSTPRKRSKKAPATTVEES